MTEEHRKKLAKAIAEELSPMLSTCGCGLSEEARREMPHLVGMVKDVGHGDYSAGIEAMRANNRIMARFQLVSEWVGKAVVGTIVLGFLALVWCIIKAGMKVNLLDVVK